MSLTQVACAGAHQPNSRPRARGLIRLMTPTRIMEQSAPPRGWATKCTSLQTCDDDAPHVIIPVLTTSAAERDIHRTLGIEAALMRQGLPPAQHLVDAGYVGADELTQSQLQYGIEVVGPIQSDGQWHAKSGEGYDVSRFVIYWDAHQAACPQGKRSRQWVERQRAGTPLISIKFAPRDCRACPVRAHCTKAQGRGRTITVHS